MQILLTILAICSIETELRNVNAMNDAGSPSYGICQVKHVAARQVRPHIKAHELEIVSINMNVAKEFYEYQQSRYQTEYCAISAYNAGHCSSKNEAYVSKVLKRRQHIKVALASKKGSLFVRLGRLKLTKSLKHHLQKAIGLD